MVPNCSDSASSLPIGVLEWYLMDQQPNQPLYWDGPSSKLNVTLIIALVVAVIGLLTSPPFIILGLALAAYSWFTTAKQFLIYENVLVIVYGRPRDPKVVPYPAISRLEVVVVPMGPFGQQQGRRLMVHLMNDRRIIVSVQNVEEFRERLDEAMRNFNDTYDEGKIIDQSPENSTPY